MENISNAKIVIADDGIHLVDTDLDVIVTTSKDGLAYVLPSNSANRKFIVVKKIEEAKANGITEIPLEYRATRTLGPVSKKLPNEKLIAYLSEDKQAEYRAIFEEAYSLYEADRAANKKQPKTEIEKLEARIAKLQAELDAARGAQTEQAD